MMMMRFVLADCICACQCINFDLVGRRMFHIPAISCRTVTAKNTRSFSFRTYFLSQLSIDPMSDDGWGRSAPIIYSSTISMDDDSWDGWGRREPRGDDAEVCVLWILDICIGFSSSMDVCV